MLKPAGFSVSTGLSAKIHRSRGGERAFWISTPSDDVPLTVTLPGVWSATLIFGSIVVPAEKERSLLVEPAVPSISIVKV